MDEELKNASEEYCPDDAYPFASDIINKEVRKAFVAGWKAKEESEKPVPADLEEAAEKFARLYDQGTCDGIAQDCFIAGAKWDRQQTLKEAVEGVVEDVGVNYIDLIDFDAEKLGLAEGDKVRIIVLKNTEK